MNEKLNKAFLEYLEENRGNPEYGVQVERFPPDGRGLQLTLTFRSGNRYCCAEPGCHLGLFLPKNWLRLRHLLVKRGIEIGSPMRVQVKGVVEEGALLGSNGKLGLHVKSDAYEYEEEYVVEEGALLGSNGKLGLHVKSDAYEYEEEYLERADGF